MAQQFQSPETYAVGQQLTASRLNNMVNNAVPLPGLITDRTAITSNTVASDDKILIYDASAAALRSSNVSDILGSGVSVVTGGISFSSQDIQINVSDSADITTASFVSADGNTVTVTATAHGFSAGGTNLIQVSGAPSTYNGVFVFTYVNANTFTYTTFSTGTPVTSPTVITVKRKGAIRNASSIVTNSHLSVTQQSEFRGTMYAKGNVNITGALNCASNATIAGNLTVTGTTTANLTTTSTAVTQTSTDSSTKIATTAFVNSWNPIKAWVNFNGNGSTVGANLTINASNNVSSVVYNGTGDYTINFTSAISDTNYAVTATGNVGTSGGCPTVAVHTSAVGSSPTLKSITQVRIGSIKDSTGVSVNQSNISVLIIR
jgi:hypothetical protein